MNSAPLSMYSESQSVNDSTMKSGDESSVSNVNSSTDVETTWCRMVRTEDRPLSHNVSNQRGGASFVDFKNDPTAGSVACDCYPAFSVWFSVSSTATNQSELVVGRMPSTCDGCLWCPIRQRSPYGSSKPNRKKIDRGTKSRRLLK